ncbi:MAG: flagellar hook-length control protein FliK [Acidovorax sp.]
MNSPLDLVGDDPPTDALLTQSDLLQADVAPLAAWQDLLVPRDAAVSATGLAYRDTETGRQPVAGLQAGRDPTTLVGVGMMPSPAGSDVFAIRAGAHGPVASSEGAPLDTAADVRGGATPNAVSGYGRAFTRLHNALSLRPDTVEGPAVRGGLAAVAAERVSSQPAGTLGTALVQVQASAVGVPAVALERTVASSLMAADQTANLVGLIAPGMEQAQDAGSRGGTDGSSPRDFGRGADGFAAPESIAGAAEPFDSALSSGEVTPSGVEDQISEQVAYWVSQETQNAELTLNRDGLPVEVSVSLSGNEAHVTFRSDQEQTRELLDRSMGQLSELLRGQGLVLSGMSVGSSAGRSLAGGQGGDQKRQREEAGHRQVNVVAPAGSMSTRATRPLDGSVDVFV